MDRYEKFKSSIKEAAQEFLKVDKNETVRIVSHLDSDGICASSILINAFNRDNRRYSISIVHQLDANILSEISQESYKVYIFSDLGSGQLKRIQNSLPDKKVFILDHHKPETEDNGMTIHVNPHNFGIDGSKEISGAGITFLFGCCLDKRNEEMAHVAVIGAIGDLQEEKGFRKLNAEILGIAQKSGKIEVSNGLRVFGSQTRPLYKLLEYSTDPYIPGVSGSESAAIQFLSQIGINPKMGKEWKKLTNLSMEEKKRLASAIILKRSEEKNPEDIFGFTYLLIEEIDESPLKDAKEFSTLLNACGRMNKASLGIGSCIGNSEAKRKAVAQLTKYRKEIINALKWYQDKKNASLIYREKGFIIINAKDYIPFTFVGTLASIISKSNEFEKSTYILSMAYAIDNTIKVSLRIAGRHEDDIDLRSIVREIASSCGGEAGGHLEAAGAIIPIEKEEELIEAAKYILRKVSMEEKIR